MEKLKINKNGKPKFRLDFWLSGPRTAINTRTQKDYLTLMRVLEVGGLKWASGELPTKSMNIWEEYRGKTCISSSFEMVSIYGRSTSFGYDSKECLEESGDYVISTKIFMKKQNITNEMITRINRWFNTRR